MIARSASEIAAGIAGGYFAPETLDQLAELCTVPLTNPVYLAGGQSIVPALRTGKIDTDLLIDLSRLTDLREIRIVSDVIQIGAMTNFVEVQRHDITARCELLNRALSYVGSHTIRNRATVGGNLAWADPRAELPLALMLYDAKVVTDRRSLPAAALPVSSFRSALAPRELILRVDIPLDESLRPAGFLELLDRHSIGKAIVSAGVVLLDDGRIRVGVGGIADRPVATVLTPAKAAEWIEGLEHHYPAIADPFHSSAYRRSMAKLLVRRLFAELGL